VYLRPPFCTQKRSQKHDIDAGPCLFGFYLFELGSETPHTVVKMAQTSSCSKCIIFLKHSLAADGHFFGCYWRQPRQKPCSKIWVVVRLFAFSKKPSHIDQKTALAADFLGLILVFRRVKCVALASAAAAPSVAVGATGEEKAPFLRCRFLRPQFSYSASEGAFWPEGRMDGNML
jgi:hypothetical protein